MEKKVSGTGTDKGKGKGKGKAKNSASEAVEEDPSLEGLAALIASRQKQRAGAMDDLIERVEREEREKAAGSGKAKAKAKGKGRKK